MIRPSARRPWLSPGYFAFILSGCYQGLTAPLGDEGADGGQPASGAETEGPGQDEGGEEILAPRCATLQVGATPLRRLTAEQYDNTVRDLLGLDAGLSDGFAPDERVGPFKSNATAVASIQVEQYQAAAEAAASLAVADLEALLPCAPADLGETACAEAFLEEFGRRAYRRPLEGEDLAALVMVYEAGAAEGGFEDGIRLAITAMLQSPFFLYHAESSPTGDASPAPLDAYALASRLSYFLWNTMPDAALFDAAGRGALETESGLAAEVDRMLAHPAAAAAIEAFALQWAGVEELERVEKDPELFPQWDPALAEAMKADIASLARHVLLEGDGTLSSLLTASYTLTDDPALLALYGVALPDDHQPGEPIPLDPSERAGILTRPGLLAAHAHPDQTSPIHRGVLVRQNFFCQVLPPPPPEVDNAPPQPDPEATTRERFAQHTADAACRACHTLIDPLGFGLEAFDSIGAHRSVDGEHPVDTTGAFVATDIDGPFEGAVEMAQRMAESQQVQACVSRQLFRYAFGRYETDDDACTTDALEAEFVTSGTDLRSLMRAIALSEGFRHRRAPEET